MFFEKNLDNFGTISEAEMVTMDNGHNGHNGHNGRNGHNGHNGNNRQ